MRKIETRDTGRRWRLLAPALVALAGLCWGAIGIFSRPLAAAGLSSLQLTLLRNLLAAAALLVPMLLRPGRLRLRLRDLWLFLGTGICSIALFNICYFACMRLSSLSVAVTLLYTSPCFVMALSCLLFRERFTPGKAAALLLALVGCMCITGVLGGGQRVGGAALVTGLLSGFGYALYSIFGKLALRRYHWLTVTFYTFFIAAAALLPFGRPAALLSSLGSGTLWLSALGLALVSTVLPFLLYTLGLSHMDAGLAAVIACVEPAAATVAGVLLFHEPLTAMGLTGLALVALSVAAAQWKPRDRKKGDAS